MLILSFWACLVLAVWFFRKARQRRERGEEGFSYHFFRDSLDFLVPFVSVLGLYQLAFVYVRHSDGIPLSTLVRIEETLAEAKTLVAPFKLNHVAMFVVLLALYLAVMLGLSKTSGEKVTRAVKFYKNAARIVYIVIVLLASFTFLGTMPGNPQLDVKLKIKTIREGYGAIRQEVTSTLVEEAAEQLALKAYDSFPPWYREAFDIPPRLASEATALSASYAKATAEYEIRDPKIEAAVAKYTVSRTEPPVRRIAVHPEPSPVPADASLAKIQRARSSLQQHRAAKAGQSSRLTTFLQRPGAQEVVLQIPKLLTGEVKNALISLSSHYPLMEPIIDSLTKTIDDTVEKRFALTINRATEAVAAGDPEAIAQQATEFVSQTSVVIPEEAVETAKEARADLDRSLSEISQAKTTLETTVRRAETRRGDAFIARLKSTDPAIREEAVARLTQSGEKLSKAQVDRLVQLMRQGKGTWTRFLYRESHCEWHEEVTVRHYAGEALANMKSPYVDEKLATEARTASAEGLSQYKVTDPGWI